MEVVRQLVEGWSRHAPGDARPSAIVVASVVDGLAAALMDASETAWGSRGLEATSDWDVGLTMDVSDPGAVGIDRILAAAEAFRGAGGPVILAALGTVAAVSAVTSDGRFVGGALLPGLATMAWSIRARTSRLPEVHPEGPVNLPGRDTENAIRSGLALGMAGALDRVTEELVSNLGQEASLVLTGGEADSVSPLLRARHTVSQDLVLRGLASAYLRGKF